MTLRQAAEILIRHRPHVARWLDEIRTGIRAGLPGAAAYLRREIDAQAGASKRRGANTQLRAAAQLWSGLSAIDALDGVAGEILQDAIGQGRKG
jgi:hypothetical protein